MRIAILAVLLLLLLSPGLRSGAAAPITTTLLPTPADPQAGGTVQIERQGGRATLIFDMHGLPTGNNVPGAARGARSERWPPSSCSRRLWPRRADCGRTRSRCSAMR